MRCVVCESRADFVDGGFSFCDLHYRMWQHGYGKSIESMRAETITQKVEPPKTVMNFTYTGPRAHAKRETMA